jgi:hypothetical protein
LGIVFSLALMLQSSSNYPTKPVRLIEPFGAGVDPICWAVPSPKSSLSSGANL